MSDAEHFAAGVTDSPGSVEMQTTLILSLITHAYLNWDKLC